MMNKKWIKKYFFWKKWTRHKSLVWTQLATLVYQMIYMNKLSMFLASSLRISLLAYFLIYLYYPTLESFIVIDNATKWVLWVTVFLFLLFIMSASLSWCPLDTFIKLPMPSSSEPGRLKSALRLVAESQRLIEVRAYLVENA